MKNETSYITYDNINIQYNNNTLKEVMLDIYIIIFPLIIIIIIIVTFYF